MKTDEKSIQEFVAQNDYDFRKTGNARFMDQKCIPDVINAVAECVLEYIKDDSSKTFTKDDIWHFDFSERLIDDVFSKPNTENSTTKSEYDKFFAQPLKLFAYAKILSETKVKGTNTYCVKEKEILEFIALREKNALIFLDIYLTKVMKDSGCFGYFETFFLRQDKQSFNELRDALEELYLKYTQINQVTEARRIYNKIINILAFKRKKKGSVKGQVSNYALTIDEIRYNRINWRDTEKSKGQSRQEYLYTINNKINKNSGYYEHAVNQAKKFVRELEIYSEVHHYPTYIATDAHHIFMKSDFPELADMPENIIALTANEHYEYAHPNHYTQRTDPDYQMICLISKLDSIERNFQEKKNDYSLSDFTTVLNKGLNTSEFNVQMGYERIKANLLRHLRPRKSD